MSFSVLQAVGALSTGSATTTVSFSALTAGSALIAVVGYGAWNSGHGAVVTGISSVGGSTWTEALNADESAFSMAVEQWVSLNVSGGTTSVTVSHADSYSTKYVIVLEVGHMVTSGTSTDGTNFTLWDHHVAPVDSGTVTPSAGVDVLLVSACLLVARSITSIPSGFTAVTISGVTLFEVAYKIVTAPSGSYDATWSINSPQYTNVLLVLAAFKSSGGGAPPLPLGFFAFFDS